MKIALVGGTGDMGEGLALRWCIAHDIFIGSRRREKGERRAREYLEKAEEFYGERMNGTISGGSNEDVVKEVEVVVLTIPYEHAESTLEVIGRSLGGKIVISPVVPMKLDKGAFVYDPHLEDGEVTSHAELIAGKIPDAVVVSAFHAISAKKLADPSLVLDYDVPLATDDEEGRRVVEKLIEEIPKLRPVYVGPLCVSSLLEALTPLLLNASKFCGLKNPSIKFL